MKSKIFISIILLTMLVVTGCSKSLEEAQVDFCQALGVYGGAARELQNVNANTTVEEMQSARDVAANARKDVLDAAGDLREVRMRVVEDAWENTQEAINDISGDATLAEAAVIIQVQSGILATEIERISNISCGRR